MYRYRRWFICGILALALEGLSLAHAQALDFHITWKDNSQDELGFRGYRVSGPNTTRTKVCETVANTQTCAVTDTIVGNNCYVMVAFNTFGESTDSNQACAGKPTTPGTVSITVP